jgi:hypothetical protein
MSKPTATIKGNKKDGYILEVSNSKDGFMWDTSLVEEELIEIYKAIGKKLKI